jgi:hypothetical protein
VEGDIVVFGAGDIVWADVRVLEVSSGPLVVLPPYVLRNAQTVQRVLTSEVEPEEREFTDARNMLWGGSTVLHGGGTGIVVHTFGKMLLDMYTDFVMVNPVWNQFNDLGRLASSGKKHFLAQFWAHQFGLSMRDCKATAKSVCALASAENAEKPCHIVLHWKSPLLRGAEPRELRVDHVRLGKLLQEEPDELMGEVFAACAVCSAGWLDLEKMKTWSSGAIPLSDVTAEGQADPVGIALLRFALSRLGAKEFWRIRQGGFRVYSTQHGLLANVGEVNYFWSRSWQEAKAMCSHFASEGGKVKSANHGFWQRARETVEQLNGKRMRTIIIGKKMGPVSRMFSDGVVLGIVVFEEIQQTEAEILEGFQLLQKSGKFKIHLRCDSLRELDEGIRLTRKRKSGLKIHDSFGFCKTAWTCSFGWRRYFSPCFHVRGRSNFDDGGIG